MAFGAQSEGILLEMSSCTDSAEDSLIRMAKVQISLSLQNVLPLHRRHILTLSTTLTRKSRTNLKISRRMRSSVSALPSHEQGLRQKCKHTKLFRTHWKSAGSVIRFPVLRISPATAPDRPLRNRHSRRWSNALALSALFYISYRSGPYFTSLE